MDGSTASGASAASQLPADCPFSAQQLSVTIFTLDCLARRSDLLESLPLRALRKTITPLVDAAIIKRFNGEDPHAHKSSRERREERHRKEQQKKAHDRDLLNKRTLRLERLRQVEAMNAAAPGVLVIPDGAVFDGVNISLGQTSGTSSVVSVQNAPRAAVAALEDAHAPELFRPRSCYVCKARFYILHHFYDQLCPECATLNWTKRMQTVDLRGKVAVLTGGRVKVGYQIALKLLRAGAFCVITSRFPADTCERLSREPDFDQWRNRVRLFGIDLRDIAAVERFCAALLAELPRLDILINNACQTVRRPPAYYQHLLANEEASLKSGTFAPLLMQATAHALPALALADGPVAASALLSQVALLPSDTAHATAGLFPKGAFDVNAQQVDLRDHTSWTTKLADVSTPEAVEVLSVNTLAPFILCARLKPLFMRTQTEHGKYIVNVSSMEGKFMRVKADVHPHLNMAKAALNMVSKTSGTDYAHDDIYMTSVDTGWLNNEAPLPTAVKIAEKNNFQTPLDEVDGASRVLDPVFSGVRDPSLRQFGCFLKDYRVTEW